MASTENAERPNDTRLVSTKLQAPTYAGELVARPHLLRRLEGLTQRKLALLHAPAGFGKTTLAVQWRRMLVDQDAKVAWLSLDRDDNDIVRFLSYLSEAFRSIAPGMDIELVSALENKTDTATRFVLAGLVNEVAALEQDLYLVLEDWHRIEAPAIHEAMNFLLAYAPANLHFLITSRTVPPLSLARLRVADQAIEIKAQDLRFDAQESRQFLSQINSLQMAEESLELLLKNTDGWVAALQLASLTLKNNPNADEVIRSFNGSDHSINEYLAENVLANLAPRQLDFLLRTSILERLSGPLCAAVSGCEDSQTILEQLERQDLFVRPLDEQRNWFRYHHMFASYLQRSLQRDMPGEAPALHLAASKWFETQGFTSDAVGHALAADDIDRAIDLIDENAMWLVEHSRMATLLSLLDRIPQQALAQRPRLQMAMGWGYCLTQRAEDARPVIDELNRMLLGLSENQQQDMQAELNVLLACIDIYADRIDRAESLLRPILDASESHRPWVVAVAANVMSYVHIHCFEFDRARELQRWASSYHKRTQGPFSGIYGHCFMGMAAAYQGNLRVAAKNFQETLNYARGSAGQHSHAARLAAALWGQINYEYNDLEHAENLLEESLALGATGGVADFSLATYISLARLRGLQGDIAAAHALLDDGLEAARQLGLERLAAAVDGERVRRYLLDGDLLHAERLLHPCEPFPEEADGIAAQTWEARELARSRVMHALGNTDAALDILKKLLSRAEAAGRQLSVVTLLVRKSLCLEAMGSAGLAEQALTRALMLGASQGMVRSFVDEGPVVVNVLQRIRETARRGRAGLPLPESVAYHVNRLIAVGNSVVPAGDADQGLPPASDDINEPLGFFVEPLKNREKQIIVLLEKGYSNKEIARNLHVSVDTVKWYLKSVYSKLAVHRRSQAVAEARRLGVI